MRDDALADMSLDRFLEAQAPVYDQARSELAAAAKRTHWMWFIFPQLKGLGRTSTAQYFGIESRAEALAYWQQPCAWGAAEGVCCARAGRAQRADCPQRPGDAR